MNRIIRCLMVILGVLLCWNALVYADERKSDECSAVIEKSVLSASADESLRYDWNKSAKQLYKGIKYTYIYIKSPRNMAINCMRIDLKTPFLRLYTTPRAPQYSVNSTETVKKTTRNFVLDSQKTDKKLVVAINADAFQPWPAPYDKAVPADLLGMAVSDGTLVSPGNGEPTLMYYYGGRVKMDITDSKTAVGNIQVAVSGFFFKLRDGKVLIDNTTDPQPRTGTGLSQDKRYLYLMTIDGRMKDSVGATTNEVGRLLKFLGAYDGINMDGGGSSTMVWWNPAKAGEDKAEILNVPVGSGSTPNTQRCNGNNLGIYFWK